MTFSPFVNSLPSLVHHGYKTRRNNTPCQRVSTIVGAWTYLLDNKELASELLNVPGREFVFIRLGFLRNRGQRPSLKWDHVLKSSTERPKKPGVELTLPGLQGKKPDCYRGRLGVSVEETE